MRTPPAAPTRTRVLTASVAAAGLLLAGCGAGTAGDDVLTVYSGRGEDLVGQVIADFEEQTGIDVEVRYAATEELARQLVEEGAASPADLFWSQDAGPLATVADEDLFTVLPDEILDRVGGDRRAEDGTWVGVTGRARVLVRSTERVDEDELPSSVLDLTDDEWAGRVGWAPANSSFQAFVTAMRDELGEEATRDWLEGMIANGVTAYLNNASQIRDVAAGGIDVGLVNHYHLLRFLAEDPDYPAANVFLDGDLGSMLDVAGIGHLAASGDADLAERFTSYVLSDEVQRFLAGVTDEAEYPLVEGIEAAEPLPPLSELDLPAIDLSALADIERTVELLQEVGALP